MVGARWEHEGALAGLVPPSFLILQALAEHAIVDSAIHFIRNIPTSRWLGRRDRGVFYPDCLKAVEDLCLKGVLMLNRISIFMMLVALLLAPRGAEAEVPFPNYPEPDLPQMDLCVNRTPIPLPEKWEAITLMSPYLYHGIFPQGANLRVGRLVYDSSVGAMRAGVYKVGDEGFLLDLLITHDNTWYLGGTWDNPVCAAVWGEKLAVPSRIWQDGEAVCVGNHRTAPTIHTGPRVDWWKQPSPIQDRGAEGEAGDWYWFDENGYPTRTFFWAKHSGLPAIISEYAFSNFYSFDPVSSTNLQALVMACEGAGNLPTLNAGQRIVHREVDQNPNGRDSISVSDLIPGLSYEACSGEDIEPPHWPQEIYMTSFSTAAKFSTPKPLRTSVYYNPAGPYLRTRLHKIEQDSQTHQPFQAFSDALLLGVNSWGIDFQANSPYAQMGSGEGPHTSIPGAPHPDWGKRGGCQCMAVIDDNPVLSPGRRTQIISCPLPDYSGDTLFWMWYTVAEPPEPIVFLQTRADITIGTGLCLADYYHWEEPPPSPISSRIYTEPNTCSFPPSSAPTPPAACLHCHNPSVNSGHGTSTWSF